MGLIFDKKIGMIYDEWYHSSEGRAINSSIEKFILSMIRPLPGERVLDVGCGSGNHLLMLKRLGLDISGIDASESMIERARERLGHQCTLTTGIAENLPFDDNEFDLVVFINTLEFLDHSLESLREAGRVASKKVFIGVINSLSWNGLVKKIQGYLGDPLFRKARFYNLWQLKSLLQAAYGDVPISWACSRIAPSFIRDDRKSLDKSQNTENQTPFGSFLGISATMIYRVKTDDLHLKIGVKNKKQSLVQVRTTFGDLQRNRGVDTNERGLPV